MIRDPAPRLEIRHAVRDGESFAFGSIGDGDPVLWLSPFAVPLQVWDVVSQGRQFLSELSNSHHVLLLDDRYAALDRDGGDHPVPEDFLDNQVSDMVAVLDAAGIERCHVVANLLTAISAIALAARHPDRVRSLLLWSGVLSGPRFAECPGWQGLLGMGKNVAIDVQGRSWVGIIGMVGGATEAREQQQIIAALRDRPAHRRLMVRGLLSSDVTTEAQSISCRSLIVAPGDSVLPGVPLIEEVARLTPGSRLIMVPGAAMSMHLDEPETALPLVREWLEEDPRAALQLDARAEVLTQRELEVCRQVALGLTNVEIADALTISKWTVQRHVSNAIRKTGAANRAELAALTTGRSK